MRIASFNLEDLGGDKQPLDFVHAKIDVLRPQLLRLNADILCFQEVNAKRANPSVKRGLYALDKLVEDTPYASFSWVATTFGKKKQFADKHNLVVLSRWPITSTEQLCNDLVSPPSYQITTSDPAETSPTDIIWDRPALWVTIRLEDGRDLHVINLHLRAPLASSIKGQKSGPFSWKSTSSWAEGFYLASIKRAGQALEARLLVDKILDQDENALIMVCGDFNAEERETPTRILCGNMDDTGNGALSSRMLIPLEHALPQSRQYTVIHQGQKIMLDHILVSRTLMSRFQGLEVHNEALGDELVAYASIENSPESYHAPIVASFNPLG